MVFRFPVSHIPTNIFSVFLIKFSAIQDVCIFETGLKMDVAEIPNLPFGFYLVSISSPLQLLSTPWITYVTPSARLKKNTHMLHIHNLHFFCWKYFLLYHVCQPQQFDVYFFPNEISPSLPITYHTPLWVERKADRKNSGNTTTVWWSNIWIHKQVAECPLDWGGWWGLGWPPSRLPRRRARKGIDTAPTLPAHFTLPAGLSLSGLYTLDFLHCCCFPIQDSSGAHNSPPTREKTHTAIRDIINNADDFFYWGRRCWMKGLIYTARWPEEWQKG